MADFETKTTVPLFYIKDTLKRSITLTQAEVDELMAQYALSGEKTDNEMQFDDWGYPINKTDEPTKDLVLECSCSSLDLFHRGCTCGYIKPGDWGLFKK